MATKEEMDAALVEAEEFLTAELLPSLGADMLEGVHRILEFHRAQYMSVGHKRLGRLYVKVLKQMSGFIPEADAE